MAKVHAIRRRIRSVRNINQITKAMEMVAASKLRRAQEATLRSRPYAISAQETLARLRLLTNATAHPLFARRTSNRRLLIVFSSDRGLAGAYNTNVFKVLLAEINTSTATTQLIMVGQKGGQLISRLNEAVDLIGLYTNWPTEPTTLDIRPLAHEAVAAFTNASVDRVQVIFTDFVSMLRQTVVAREILPVNPSVLDAQMHLSEAIFEPSPQDVLSYVVPRLVEVQLLQCALEASASEQAARMMAMKNASDNASEITEDLTLTYNGARQAAITQELAEITSGAEAMR